MTVPSSHAIEQWVQDITPKLTGPTVADPEPEPRHTHDEDSAISYTVNKAKSHGQMDMTPRHCGCVRCRGGLPHIIGGS